MENKILIKTQQGNNYLQDTYNNYLIHLPRELCDIFSLNNNDNLENTSNESKSNSEGNESYYYRKFKFLNKNLSKKTIFAENFSERLSETFIKNQLINCKQIVFEVTQRCSLNCKYCGYGEFYADYDKRKNKDLSWTYARSVLDYFAKYWTSPEFPSIKKHIAISFYGGEPLLNIPLIEKIIKYLNNLKLENIVFLFNMTTNGILLDKFIEFLIKNNFLLSISLDGDEFNNSYRVDHIGKNNFSKVFENVKLVMNKYPKYFSSNVQFISVLHNRNSVPLIRHFFKTNFDKIPTILNISPVNIRPEKLHEFRTNLVNLKPEFSEIDDYELIIKDLFIKDRKTQMLMFYLHSYSGNIIRSYNHFFKDVSNFTWLPTGTCSPFSKRFFITVDGMIFPCERINQKYALGSTDGEKIDLNFDKIAQMYNDFYDKLTPQCLTCYKLKGCLQCIFHLDLGQDDIVCKEYLNKEKFKEQLSLNISFLEKNPGLYKKIMEEVVLEY